MSVDDNPIVVTSSNKVEPPPVRCAYITNAHPYAVQSVKLFEDVQNVDRLLEEAHGNIPTLLPDDETEPEMAAIINASTIYVELLEAYKKEHHMVSFEDPLVTPHTSTSDDVTKLEQAILRIEATQQAMVENMGYIDVKDYAAVRYEVIPPKYFARFYCRTIQRYRNDISQWFNGKFTGHNIDDDSIQSRYHPTFYQPPQIYPLNEEHKDVSLGSNSTLASADSDNLFADNNDRRRRRAISDAPKHIFYMGGKRGLKAGDIMSQLEHPPQEITIPIPLEDTFAVDVSPMEENHFLSSPEQRHFCGVPPIHRDAFGEQPQHF